MLHKLQAVVLNTINYNDKYILAQVYTDTLGRVTYMVPKTSGKTSKVRKSSFTPLSVLEMETEHRDNRDIQRIREVRVSLPLIDIPNSMYKTSMVFFLSEFLTKVLREVNENSRLFEFLVYSVQVLEYEEKSISNFHLVFMLNLTRFLGFYPNLEDYRSGQVFDMLNGIFTDNQPAHNHYISHQESFALSKLGRINYENMHLFKFSRQERINIINRMLEYYRIHLHDFPPVKSLEVLHELF